MYLMVEFPRVKANDKEYCIVYYEKVGCVLRTAEWEACEHRRADFVLHRRRMETTIRPSSRAATS